MPDATSFRDSRAVAWRLHHLNTMVTLQSRRTEPHRFGRRWFFCRAHRGTDPRERHTCELQHCSASP
jgi:hypothetical protein